MCAALGIGSEGAASELDVGGSWEFDKDGSPAGTLGPGNAGAAAALSAAFSW